MAKSGPVILLEDDEDDKAMFVEALRDLGVPNEVIWFTNTDKAFNYLKTSSDQPFIIFSDVNLPPHNGIEFKRRVDDDPELRRKSIPFVFYSTTADQRAVNEAYTQMTVQGFFEKANTYNDLKDDLRMIVEYWSRCKHPNAG